MLSIVSQASHLMFVLLILCVVISILTCPTNCFFHILLFKFLLFNFLLFHINRCICHLFISPIFYYLSLPVLLIITFNPLLYLFFGNVRCGSITQPTRV